MKLEKIPTCIDCNTIVYRCLDCHEKMNINGLMSELIEEIEKLDKIKQKDFIKGLIKTARKVNNE